MSVRIGTDLPVFRFASSELPGDQAYEAWRDIMARMFLVEQSTAASRQPGGAMFAVLLGEIMANRSLFTAQRLTRDTRRIASTPDHLVLQLYRSGGYVGAVGERSARIAKDQIAICDLRHPLDVQAQNSDTIGLTIPRKLLEGIDFDRLPVRLEPHRERLLAARMSMLHLRLPTLSFLEASTQTAELVAVLRRLFDPSNASDVLEGHELDRDLVTLSEYVIASGLALPDLSPAMIAERLRVSRATLFRAFAPFGGVTRRIWAMRLQAVQMALEQPEDRRTLSRLGNDFGFKSSAHLSRAFRARYGVTPSEWRAQRTAPSNHDWSAGLDRLNGWWRSLGQ